MQYVPTLLTLAKGAFQSLLFESSNNVWEWECIHFLFALYMYIIIFFKQVKKVKKQHSFI